ncbi:MAG: hypothetical protein AMXMBFR84_09490 [Candidatus Hydrogenedentota bacterium]
MHSRWIVCLLVAGCATAYGDSLFSKTSAERGNLISNKRPQYEEGDLIVVTVRETLNAETSADTNTRKQAEVSNEADAGDNGFLINPKPDGLGLLDEGKLPNWQIEADNEHRTTGETVRTNRLTTTISCTVTKVNDNGTLDIQGEKRVTVNSEDTTMFLTGTIRALDVTAANTIDSTKVANAKIDLKGKGPLWNNQRRGWITKLLDWFAPY